MDLESLQDLAVLRQLTEDQRRDLLTSITRREYRSGEAILTQGTSTGGFHVIESGSVRVMLEGEPRVQVAAMGTGEYFGEISALTGDAHSATVEAMEPTVTIEFTHGGLLALLSCNPQLNQHVLRTLARRVKRTNRRVQEVYTREAALARYVSDQEEAQYGQLVGISPAVTRLRESVASLAQVQDPVILVGERGCGKVHLAAQIHVHSPHRQRPFVIMPAVEWTAENWERHLQLAEGGCVIVSDLQRLPATAARAVAHWLRGPRKDSARFLGTYTLAAAEAPGRLPPPLDPESLAAWRCTVLRVPPLRERRDDIPSLVLHFLRAAKKHPTGDDLSTVITPEAMRLLGTFPFLQGNVDELETVVRQAALLAGDGPIAPEHLRLGQYRKRPGRPTVGLALGGGVVRGAAHVGVLKVLTENGIPVDCIAGTSSGALVGGLYAAGMSVAAMEQLALGMSWLDLVRLVLPVAALAHNRPTRRFMERNVGPVTFADLRIPFAAVAADYLTGAPEILQEGSLAEAIQASTAIPTLIRPVLRDGRLLVDGFVISTVPVLVARSLGADLVVAVDVGIPVGGRQPGNLWAAVMRALDIMSRRQADRELDWADVVVNATDPVANPYSFRHARRFLQAGEAAATEALPLIRRRLAELAEERA